MDYADSRHAESIKHSNKLFDEAARRYEKLMKDVIEVRRQEQHSKELLIGILSRLQKDVEAQNEQ